jgi:hypothetical protein
VNLGAYVLEILKSRWTPFWLGMAAGFGLDELWEALGW